MGPTTYKLDIPNHWKRVRLHDTFHASLLTPYHENDIYGPNQPRPPPEIDQDTYEVERILRHQKFRDGTYQYLIKWKGYPEDEATWHREADLEGAEKIVTQYKKTHIEKRKRAKKHKHEKHL